MPTREQRENAVAGITRVVEEEYFIEDDILYKYSPEMPRGVPDDSFSFATLGPEEGAKMLRAHVQWEGFTEGERADVINRVLDAEKPERWMEGIKNHNPENDFSRPLTEKQHEGYLSDVAANFGMTSEEMDDYYHRVESYPDEAKGGLDDGPVRPLTEQLIAAAHLDLWPSMAAIVDFGIDSEKHLGALQFAITHEEATPQELDTAMGDGAKLTEIAQRGDNPYRDVTFRTSWDNLRLEPPEEHDASEIFIDIPAKKLHAQSGVAEKSDLASIFRQDLKQDSRKEQHSQEKGREDDGRDI